LVTGAGPTGLALTFELAPAGVDRFADACFGWD